MSQALTARSRFWPLPSSGIAGLHGRDAFRVHESRAQQIHEMTPLEAVVRVSESALLVSRPDPGGIGLFDGRIPVVHPETGEATRRTVQKLIENGHQVPIELVFDSKFLFDRKQNRRHPKTRST